MAPIVAMRSARIRRVPAFRALLLISMAAAAGCARQPWQLETDGQTMGTTYSVKVAFQEPPSRSERKKWSQDIPTVVQNQLDEVNDRMSTYKPDSELSRFNQFHETTPYAVSSELLDVFEMAEQVSKETDGAFDITVGPVVNAWGFGPTKRTETAPSEEELNALRARVGYQLVTIDSAASTLQKHNPDVYCDLSAIAKGYGVDRVALALESLGCRDYMVEVGGEVRASGLNSHGEPWRIGIERPNVEGRMVYQAVPLLDNSMATSGDYRNYYEIDGVRYSHEIDPKTLRPIGHQLASVSVVDAQCALADAYATAFMVMGPEKGYDKAVALGLPAYFIVYGSGDAYTNKITPAFTALEQAQSTP